MARPRAARKGRGPWFGTPGFDRDLVPPWREQRLPRATAEAVAALIQGAHLGRCAVLPGTQGWDVLVELGPVPGEGELVLLASLGHAAPLLARAFAVFGQGKGWRAAREALDTPAERQIREALTDVLATRAEEAEEEATP